MDSGEDVIVLIYRYARRYVSRCVGLCAEDRKDVIQEIAIKTARDEARGMPERLKARYTHRKWLWLQVRKHGNRLLKRTVKSAAAGIEEAEKVEASDMERLTAEMLADMDGVAKEAARLLLEGYTLREVSYLLNVDAREIARMVGEYLRGEKWN